MRTNPQKGSKTLNNIYFLQVNMCLTGNQKHKKQKATLAIITSSLPLMHPSHLCIYILLIYVFTQVSIHFHIIRITQLYIMLFHTS